MVSCSPLVKKTLPCTESTSEIATYEEGPKGDKVALFRLWSVHCFLWKGIPWIWRCICVAEDIACSFRVWIWFPASLLSGSQPSAAPTQGLQRCLLDSEGPVLKCVRTQLETVLKVKALRSEPPKSCAPEAFHIFVPCKFQITGNKEMVASVAVLLLI